MNKNEYKVLVEKLANEMIEGIEKEAGAKEMAGAAKTYFNASASKVKGAKNMILEQLKKTTTSAADKAKDAAQKVKDSKAYGYGKGMLGSTKAQTGLAAAAGFGAGFGAGVGASRLANRKKEAAEINDFIEKVAAHNNMSIEDTAEILERVASAYQEAISVYEDSQLRKEAAGEVYDEAEADEVEAAAQLEAAVQVMEELGIPVEELIEDEIEGEDEE
jgi:hypothetical protein